MLLKQHTTGMQMRIFLTILAGAGFALIAGCISIQREALFFPSHHGRENGLTAWNTEGRTIGYSRLVATPKNVWLMLPGNGGQAADRAYALACFSEQDSVFILEYPGYGARAGQPSYRSIDAAAVEAYLLLRKNFPQNPVCVVGESIGSGPASILANQPQPPDKMVFLVPFDTLASVAAERFPLLPTGSILGASWDNIRSLSSYRGPVEVFGAEEDAVIPIAHAQRLSDSLPLVKFHRIPGGHNEWSRDGRVEIRNP